MAVTSLWPWGAWLLMILLSLGFGLDKLEGESPALSPRLSSTLDSWNAKQLSLQPEYIQFLFPAT
jgi:hypothetical protein